MGGVHCLVVCLVFLIFVFCVLLFAKRKTLNSKYELYLLHSMTNFPNESGNALKRPSDVWIDTLVCGRGQGYVLSTKWKVWAFLFLFLFLHMYCLNSHHQLENTFSRTILQKKQRLVVCFNFE